MWEERDCAGIRARKGSRTNGYGILIGNYLWHTQKGKRKTEAKREAEPSKTASNSRDTCAIGSSDRSEHLFASPRFSPAGDSRKAVAEICSLNYERTTRKSWREREGKAKDLILVSLIPGSFGLA